MKVDGSDPKDGNQDALKRLLEKEADLSPVGFEPYPEASPGEDLQTQLMHQPLSSKAPEEQPSSEISEATHRFQKAELPSKEVLKDVYDASTKEKKTILRGLQASISSIAPSSLEPLPILQLSEVNGRPPELLLQDSIGSGGMADVFAAQQVALRRTVAVKILKGDESRFEAATELIREARLTGALEHPNIVPIYGLGMDPQGRPLLVMKRIEGKSWLDFLQDGDLSTTSPGVDPLEWHIEILKQVCRAVQFSHNHGIVHRDIKPSNVMIGRFGEVYLLDWGIATRRGQDDLVKKGEGAPIVGSPAYMAPEMLMGQPNLLDERTDIYLLGAVLHRVITGQLRHQADSPMALWHVVHASEPHKYGLEIPQELGDICNRATHADPSKRYQSVIAFRQALDDFLEHRSSVSLGQQTQVRLDRLLKQSAGEEHTDALDEFALHRVFGECLFGFQQALRTWPENEQARAGLQTTLEKQIEHELEQQRVHNALRLIEELPSPNPSLEGKVRFMAQQKRQDDKHIESLRQLEQDLDPNSHRNIRSLLALGAGVLTAFAMGVTSLLVRSGIIEYGHAESIVQSVGMVISFWLMILGLSKWLLTNRVNRNVTLGAGAVALFFVLNRVRAPLMAVDALQAASADSLIFGLGLTLITINTDLRVWVGVPVFILTSLLASYFSNFALEINALGTFLAFFVVSLTWLKIERAQRKGQ